MSNRDVMRQQPSLPRRAAKQLKSTKHECTDQTARTSFLDGMAGKASPLALDWWLVGRSPSTSQIEPVLTGFGWNPPQARFADAGAGFGGTLREKQRWLKEINATARAFEKQIEIEVYFTSV